MNIIRMIANQEIYHYMIEKKNIMIKIYHYVKRVVILLIIITKQKK